ncbi:MAG: ATP-binding cassette domain-containing protein [Desulfovibrio sp.]
MAVLKASSVTKTYTKGGFFSRSEPVPVLRGVDLTVEEGECVGLIGRSGSGKSTLGRILLGLESPDTGTISIQGKQIQKKRGRPQLSLEQRRSIQVVFQDAIGSVNPRLTARDIIAEPLRNFEKLRSTEINERVEKLLVSVGLKPDDAAKLPTRFSGGQLQRISIARALAAKPRCIVLDEAVSSLDMLAQARILDLLDELRTKQGVSYLFVTHDLRLVNRFCDRAVLMEDGRLHTFDHTAHTSEPKLPVLQQLSAALLPASPQGNHNSETPLADAG